ncbi:hypothetical protein BGX33_001034 [Mortierella sp. NVP41]|nr:hypothetical protein BGX33_001034 [Mortierella sp. NVP41]
MLNKYQLFINSSSHVIKTMGNGKMPKYKIPGAQPDAPRRTWPVQCPPKKCCCEDRTFITVYRDLNLLIRSKFKALLQPLITTSTGA